MDSAIQEDIISVVILLLPEWNGGREWTKFSWNAILVSFKPVKENDAPFREYKKRAWQDIEPVETTRQRGSDYVGGIRKMFASCGKWMDKTLDWFRGYGRREKTEMEQRLKKMLIGHNTW